MEFSIIVKQKNLDFDRWVHGHGHGHGNDEMKEKKRKQFDSFVTGLCSL